MHLSGRGREVRVSDVMKMRTAETMLTMLMHKTQVINEHTCSRIRITSTTAAREPCGEVDEVFVVAKARIGGFKGGRLL